MFTKKQPPSPYFTIKQGQGTKHPIFKGKIEKNSHFIKVTFGKKWPRQSLTGFWKGVGLRGKETTNCNISNPFVPSLEAKSHIRCFAVRHMLRHWRREHSEGTVQAMVNPQIIRKFPGKGKSQTTDLGDIRVAQNIKKLS